MAVVSVTTSAGSPLADLADVAVEVPMGAEALHGSTRLTAGTATKLALDALTTAAMVRLGRVHDNLMIDVVPANAKLRERSAGQVAAITGVLARRGPGGARGLRLERPGRGADAAHRPRSRPGGRAGRRPPHAARGDRGRGPKRGVS